MNIFGISENKLGSELWAMKEKVSDPYPPSPTGCYSELLSRTMENLTPVSNDLNYSKRHLFENLPMSGPTHKQAKADYFYK